MKNKILDIWSLFVFSPILSLVIIYLMIGMLGDEGYSELKIATLFILAIFTYFITFSIVNTMLTYRYYSEIAIPNSTPIKKWQLFVITFMGSVLVSVVVDFIWFKLQTSSFQIFLDGFAKIVADEGGSSTEKHAHIFTVSCSCYYWYFKWIGFKYFYGS